ncbi:hypothetical protein NE237_004564 [Protea cynaroides]|uniref:Uncharacterized protein n=1 Tax=Protea cynaroides TaxID=273540 RepID=A0A9Q0KJ74_9MAGN|nr:hypothetical protein NE237_004564 [Protea cynaroides]
MKDRIKHWEPRKYSEMSCRESRRKMFRDTKKKPDRTAQTPDLKKPRTKKNHSRSRLKHLQKTRITADRSTNPSRTKKHSRSKRKTLSRKKNHSCNAEEKKNFSRKIDTKDRQYCRAKKTIEEKVKKEHSGRTQT